jgi:hypothetical protein
MLMLLSACDQAPPKQLEPSDAQARITDLEKQLGPADVQSFGGGNKLPIGGPLASITVPQSADETLFIDAYGCIDEVDCYGRGKFDRFAGKTYPDINRVHFNVDADLAQDDKIDIDFKKQDFRRGLYFAKIILLADGSTLFDLITKCSKTVSPYNWAEAVYDSESKTPYFSMQFFPVFRQDATGQEFEIDILLDRRGNLVTARSPMFSSSILRDRDFMANYRLSCWPRR